MATNTQQRRSSGAGLTVSILWAAAWLLGTAAICWGAATRFAPLVEDRIHSKAQSALAPLVTAATPVVVSVHGRDATLTGRATDEQHRANLLSTAENVIGVRAVVDQLDLVQSGSSPVIDTRSATVQTDSGSSNSSTAATTLTMIDSNSSESPPDATVDQNNAEGVVGDTEANIETENTASAIETNTETRMTSDTGAAYTDKDTFAKAEAESWPAEPSEGESENAEIATNEASDNNTEAKVVESETNINVSVAESDTTTLLDPSLDFNIEGKTLAVSGQISGDDDIAPLIRTAMLEFDLDYISNTIEVSDEVASASWLESLSTFLPDMATLKNPSIEVNQGEIQLGGKAPDSTTQDAVVDAAIAMLGDYKMREDIALVNTSVSPSTEDANSSDLAEAEAEAEANAEANAETVSTADLQGTSDLNVDLTSASNDAVESDDTSDDKVLPDQDISISDNTVATDPSLPTEDSDAIGRTIEDNKADSVPAATTFASIQAGFDELPSMDILFKSSSDILTIESLDVLDSIANVLKAHPDIPVRIEGHTDASGAKEDNLILSQLRANAVRDYLVDRGVTIYRLKAYGFGEGVPVSDNSTPEGRADNRRIEFNFQR